MIDNLSTAYAAGVYLEFISGRKPSQVVFCLLSVFVVLGIWQDINRITDITNSVLLILS